MNQLIEIVFFAALAAYLFFRLWSVLGRNTAEDEDRQEQKQQKLEEMGSDNNIISLPARPQKPQVENDPYADLPPGIREGLRQLQEKDSTFDLDDFLKGARYAFSMIVEAFAKGDRETLKELLYPEVYDSFRSALDSREAAHQTMETIIEKINRIEIDSIEIQDNQVNITLRYKTHQIITTSDKDGNIIDNPARISLPMTDIWTFSRPIGSDNPNWFLASTRAETYRH